MNNTKKYLNINDNELLYLIGENSEDANEIIFEKYKPVIDYYVCKYLPFVSGKGIDYNDLYQEGLIGLDSAIKGFKNKKDIKFSTFAFLCIKRKIFTAVKNANRKKHSILNESFSLDVTMPDENRSFIDFIKSSDGGIEDLLVSKENIEYFNDMLNKELSEYERRVYDLRVSGFNYEEIANMLDKTVKSVESVLFRIRVKIRNILKEIEK